MAKKRRRNDRLQCGGRPKGTCDRYGNPTSLEHPSTDSLSQSKASSAANDDDDIEVVVDSQESVGSTQYAENSDDDSIIILEDDEWEDSNYDKRMDFKFKAKEICLLYAKFGGKEWEYPLQSECPFRDAQNLLAQRMESFNQMKALCLRLEAYINEDLAAETYLSFDDTTQRDALEIMNIRYEELADDIFGCDGDCVSLFDDDEMSICSDHRTRNQSTSSSEYLDSGANYAEICMQSKLTEVGLRYVNKVYKVLRHTNATVTEYRKKTSQCVENLRAVDLKLSQIRQEFGNLSLLVAEAIDSDWI
uniref:Enhancer of polycomb-like protein n=1 Tax=Angiostrongylus cantonensis TaxID=6313 RepID=A0A158P8M8_ANGCA